MSVLIQGDQVATVNLGIRVSRASATLPQTASGAIYTITGGKVMITSSAPPPHR